MGLDRLDLALSAFKLWEKIDDPVGFKIGYISLSSYLFHIITQRKMMQKKIKDNSSWMKDNKGFTTAFLVKCI